MCGAPPLRERGCFAHPGQEFTPVPGTDVKYAYSRASSSSKSKLVAKVCREV